jgi:membrane protein implicated in regulation of membrane protease activity
MLLIFVDLILFAILVLVCLYTINRSLRAYRQNKIDSALARQADAEHMAKVVQELNPERVIENETKVNETLNKLH